MTQSVQMLRLVPTVGVVLFSVLLAKAVPAQSALEDYYAEDAHPRLLLTARRTRLLQRERERKTMRWVQFEALMKGGARMPEPGFAEALYYAVSSDESRGRKAVEWALQDGRDLRQLALVFDWCQALLAGDEARRLAAKLEQGMKRLAGHDDLASIRSRAFAAIALGMRAPEVSARELHWVVESWWRGRIAPGLAEGRIRLPRDGIYPLMEILHAVDENFRMDLRLDCRSHFASLPAYLLLTYYPALYPAAENEYHIPVIPEGGEPNLETAALARAADLSMVAYDPNSVETQYLQGWSMRDGFLMRGAFGIPYEFLWANPYQPGLSYYNAPLSIYDKNSGTLVARSSWDSDAVWFYLEDGVMQTFSDGRIRVLNWDSFSEPMGIADLVVLPFRSKDRFAVDTRSAMTYYLIGLEPEIVYDIEVDDEELFEVRADRGGIVALSFPEERKAGVRVRKYQHAD